MKIVVCPIFIRRSAYLLDTEQHELMRCFIVSKVYCNNELINWGLAILRAQRESKQKRKKVQIQIVGKTAVINIHNKTPPTND